MPTELLYHGKPMKSSVTVRSTISGIRSREGVELSQIADDLGLGRAVDLTLEPGDGTRYDLILAPITSGDRPQQGLGVLRQRGGNFIAGGLLWNWCEGPSDFDLSQLAADLHNGSLWTEVLLLWWFTSLCEVASNA